MSEPVVRIEGLSKRYRIGRRVGAVPVPKIFGFAPPDMTAKERHEPEADEEDDEELDDEQQHDETQAEGPAREVWVLRNISLDVSPGAAVGIIGPNGSGKSTLLKVLSRVTPPTEGRVELRGRVAPVLEIASGFMHPDVTGRGNVLLLARLFGVPGDVVDRQMGDIFAFAEMGGLEHAQLKRYSSGMSKRLAFSVALNLEPDILLSDGILGVGDAAFRERCLQHVERANRRGLALLFASHELDTVRRLCREVVWLEEGQVHRHGPADETLDEYEAEYGSGDVAARNRARKTRATPSRAANEFGTLLRARIVTRDGRPVRDLGRDDEAVIEWEADVLRGAEIGFSLILFGEGGIIRRLRSPSNWTVEFPTALIARVDLLPGALPGGRFSARAAAWLVIDDRRTKLMRDGAFTFDVDESPDDEEEQPELEAWVAGVRNWRLELGP